MTTEVPVLAPKQVRTSAEHLRAVLEDINSGALGASARQRAYIAGALSALQGIDPAHRISSARPGPPGESPPSTHQE
jgi:hypothetical protein